MKCGRLGTMRRLVTGCGLLALAALACARGAAGQAPASQAPKSEAPGTPTGSAGIAATTAAVAPGASAPIAIVPLGGKKGAAATVTGALEVTGDKAMIAASGSVTSGDTTTDVTLPDRGVLRVCTATTVKLAADTSVPKDEKPGLLMALDHGALEADFATGRNSDMVLTPDFRILISGPGEADVKVRLGKQGDTCVDNAGINAPYVLVSSLFGGGVYRVQAGQRVMFEHGSLQTVVDNEKEPCGCPPAVKQGSNEFPLAQSEGLAPLAKPAEAEKGAPPETHLPLVYNSAEHAPKPAAQAQTPKAAPAAPTAEAAAVRAPAVKHKHGFFRSIGRFFKRIFGAD